MKQASKKVRIKSHIRNGSLVSEHDREIKGDNIPNDEIEKYSLFRLLELQEDEEGDDNDTV